MYTIHTSNFPGFTGAGPRHQPTPVFLPEKSHGEKSLVGYSPWGHKELDMTEHAGIQAYIPERRTEGEEEKMEGGRRKKEGKEGRKGKRKGRRDEKEDEKRQMFKCCNRSKEMKGHGHL